MSQRPKTTSFEYGEESQLQQLQKYRDRRNNHWAHRIALARDLVNTYSVPRLNEKDRAETIVVDVGCSIGTFAIEFAREGFSTYGVDFDPVALRLAVDLAAEEGVTARFVCMDVSEWRVHLPPIDIAICFDLFEHLHDDELGSLLQQLRKQLSPGGSIVFHSFPTQYEYLLHGRQAMPMRALGTLPPARFERVVKAYAAAVDVACVLATGETYKDRIRMRAHCNPMTKARLSAVLRRAGYEIVCIETAQLYPDEQTRLQQFLKQPIADMNLFGVAVSKED